MKIIIISCFISLGLWANDFWKPFDDILKKSIVYYNYSSIDGDFYHTGFSYKKVKNDANLTQLLEFQKNKLKNYTFQSNEFGENLSFWINAYNFFTIVDVIKNFPIKSMKSDIGWDNIHHNISGKNYSLNHIEHKIIRKYNDARIHFAINCASVGCPALINQVFMKKNLNTLLDAVAKNALLNPLHLYKSPKKERYYHTKLFSWFSEDFEKGSYRNKDDFLKKFAPIKYKNIDSTRSISYDWDLNNPENISKKLIKLKEKYIELNLKLK